MTSKTTSEFRSACVIPNESKDFDNTASLTLLANDVTVPLVDVEHSASFSNVSGSVTANWTPAPGQLVYASYSRGFKSGGFNGGLVFSPIEVEPFVEEILTAYEVGFKSLFFDNRVRLSAAGFFYDYEDLQTFTQILGRGGATGYGAHQCCRRGNRRIRGGTADASHPQLGSQIGVGVP